MFEDINSPNPKEIKLWMIEVKLTITDASYALGISKRQFSRFLSGETKAKKVHGLAMQMLWLVEENRKDIEKSSELKKNKNKKRIKINIK
ncbi:MAG: hypothetical protein CMN00_04085 [Rickettsiales bacterium]|nr:hypothetical protein [Rickettsiales bacterium]|tara:strand:+ start:497 stop:766 length:270 start_codon:yes stop_codon:yes gene_type:complete